MTGEDRTLRSQAAGGSERAKPGKTSTPGDFYQPGDIVGSDYKILEMIGRGGMGTVFRAQHTLMHAIYALKILQPEMVNESTWLRFQKEAQVLARLTHPGIVQIYNMGIDKQRSPYFVMELLKGEPLSDVIARHRCLPSPLVATIFLPVVGALAFSHKHGVVHRDMKPSNIMLLGDGTKYTGAKIVDFGIARTEHLTTAEGQSLTTTGEIFGTPFYMSPERIAGNQNDHRSDIYSLGCAIFEALTGEPPYNGETMIETLTMHQNAPLPTLVSANPYVDYPPRWEAFVARALAKNPEARFQSMEEVEERLKQLTEDGFPIAVSALGTKVRAAGPNTAGDTAVPGSDTTQSKLPTRRGFPPWAVAVPILLLLVVVGAVAFISLRPRQNPNPAQPKFFGSAAGTPSHIPDQSDRVFKGIKHYSLGLTPDKKQRRFHFPKEPSIGKISRDGTSGPYIEAKGDVSVEDSDRLGFRMETDFTDVSELSKFNPDDFVFLRVSPQSFAELVALVKGWTRMKILWIGSCVVSSQDDLQSINSLHQVKELHMDHCSVPGEMFSKLTLLEQLTMLQLEAITDNTLKTRNMDALIVPIKEWKHLENLNIDRCEFSHNAIKSIATSQTIKELAFRRLLGTSITDEDILTLSSMPSLQTLYLGSSRLTPDSIEYFKKFKNLKSLTLEKQIWKPEVFARLSAALPHTSVNFPNRQKEDIEREEIRKALMRPHGAK